MIITPPASPLDRKASAGVGISPYETVCDPPAFSPHRNASARRGEVDLTSYATAYVPGFINEDAKPHLKKRSGVTSSIAMPLNPELLIK